MIKLDHVHIEDFRGIRSLDIDLRSSNLVVSGPNGSGKSGVIDAIDFALTGRIRRLSGTGTGRLTVRKFGPHVDVSTDATNAFVRLKVSLTGIGKSATITRSVNAPSRPAIDPEDGLIRETLDEVADHPEFALSRREVVRFILVEPKNRALLIQSILHLEKVSTTRGNIATAYNRIKRNSDTEKDKAVDAQRAFLRHLDVDSFNKRELLEIINGKRGECGTDDLSELSECEALDAGLPKSDDSTRTNKKAALRELESARVIGNQFGELGSTHAELLNRQLQELESDPELQSSLGDRLFLQQGIDRINGKECPLCGVEWQSEEELRTHLLEELKLAERAESFEKPLLASARDLGSSANRVTAMTGSVVAVASGSAVSVEFVKQLARWQRDLTEFRASMESIEGVIKSKERIKSGWLCPPTCFTRNLEALTATVESWPDQSALLDAQTFLIRAQVLWGTYCTAEAKNKETAALEKAGRAINDAYSNAIDRQLDALYEAVVVDFTSFYRQLNKDDESGFAANLISDSGSVDFEVDFYGRGMNPPGAYHSEGHQDGMGVCLYLALMKHLYGERFSFALLDDVVMSVDANHRRQFCKLLKSEFENTQFVITTHDRLWAQQMKSMRLVGGNSVLRFYGWSIDSGPMVETDAKVWNRIDDHVAKGEITIAAAVLRNYLEFAYFHLADDLCAEVQFRSDGDYGLEELCGPVIGRTMKWYKRAAAVADSWHDREAKQSAVLLRRALGKLVDAANVERWAINKAVHFNAWANFEKAEFEPVVNAHRELLAAFECADCKNGLYISSRNRPGALRCDCSSSNWNLVANS